MTFSIKLASMKNQIKRTNKITLKKYSNKIIFLFYPNVIMA